MSCLILRLKTETGAQHFKHWKPDKISTQQCHPSPKGIWERCETKSEMLLNYKKQTLNVYNIHITLTPSNFYQEEHQSPPYFSGCSLTLHIRRVTGFRLKLSSSLASSLHLPKITYNNEYMLWNISSLLAQNSSSSFYSTSNRHHRKPCNSCYNFACIKITLFFWLVLRVPAAKCLTLAQ